MRIIIDDKIQIPRGEMLRYARCKDDSGIEKEADRALETAESLIAPAAAVVRLPIVRTESRLFVADTELNGDAIKRHLYGCEECFIMGATVGFEIDRKIAALSAVQPSMALLVDAAASAAVEEVCDICCEKTEKMLDGEYLTRRFSPGYSDLPLTVQPALLSLLNAGRDIGLTVLESLLLSPVKSVTAIMGVKKGRKPPCGRNKCVNCGADCDYRRK